MNPSPHRSNDEKLEQLIHRTLRELPERRAPRSLETRVLAELSRRAALPWWRKNVAQWPVPALVVFALVSVGAAKLVLAAMAWVMAGFGAAEFQALLAQPISWWESGRSLLNAATGFVDIVLRNVPALWLYGGLAFVAAMYVALFGLGAAAYRVFRAQS